MKKWLLAATLAATAVSGVAQAKDWKEVRFGIEGAYPPFSWTEGDGSLKGFDVDMANALCQEMQVKCKIVAQDWDGIIPSAIACLLGVSREARIPNWPDSLRAAERC